MKYILFFLLLTMTLHSKSNVKTEMISEYEQIASGMQFKVAIKMIMSNEWYIYWKNPGDAGLATYFEWVLPENVDIIDEKWEIPEKIFFQDMASFGYKKKDCFYFTFKIDDPAPNNSDLMLKVKSNWLECKEKCVAGESVDSIMIKISDNPLKSNSDIFKDISSKVPEENSDWRFSAVRKSKSILLDFHKPSVLSGNFNSVIFIPYENGIFNNGSKQHLTKSGDSYTLEILLDPLRTEEPKIIKGILISDRLFFTDKDINSIEVEAQIED